MSIVLVGSTSGSITLQEPAIAGNTTQTFQPQSGTLGLTIGQIGMKNRIINGAMVIDQRNAGALINPAVSNYTVDRWYYFQTQTSKGTIGQDAGAVTPPAGFTDYLGFTSTSAYSINSTDQFLIQQSIEGFNVADFGWGTANAKTVTLSFWVRSSLTGTFGGAFQNNAANRNYPFSYTISAANTWEYKTITVAGDTSGTWNTTNGRGIVVIFSLGTGSTYSATAGSWTGSSFITSATGATSVVGTNGATFYITGVQLEVGNTATSFDFRPYGTEFMLCQRYFQTLANGPGGAAQNANNYLFGTVFQTQMRTAPSGSVTGPIRISDITTSAYTQSSGAISSNLVTSEGGSFSLPNFLPNMTTGRFALLAQSGTGTIQFSAEL